MKRTCAPFRASGGYVNFSGEAGSAEEVRDAYGAARFDRLVAVKQRWDPENLFRLNQNIRP